MTDQDRKRRNRRLGLILWVVFIVLFTVAVMVAVVRKPYLPAPYGNKEVQHDTRDLSNE